MTKSVTSFGDAQAGGQYLKQLRIASGLTYPQIEAATNGILYRQLIYRIEVGKVAQPTLHDLSLLANLYHVSPNDIARQYKLWDAGPSNVEALREPAIANVVGVWKNLPAEEQDYLRTKLEEALALTLARR